MKTYYVEEEALVIVQHLVKAKSEKEAIQLVKDGEAEHSEIIEYLGDEMQVTEVGIFNDDGQKVPPTLDDDRLPRD